MSKKESLNMDSDAQAPDILVVVFMIDTSSSMDGEKINAVNNSMDEIKSVLQKFERTNSRHAEIQFAVLKFDSDIQWCVCPPKPLDDFIWDDLKADGCTAFGRACKEVESKLHDGTDLFSEKRSYLEPLVILLSDGEPYDPMYDQDCRGWKENLRKLKENEHFKNGTHIAIGLPGIDEDGKAVLKDFAKENCYIEVNDVEKISSVITLATMVATQSLSASGSLTNTNVANTAAVSNVVNSLANMQGVDVVDLSDLQMNEAEDYNLQP